MSASTCVPLFRLPLFTFTCSPSLFFLFTLYTATMHLPTLLTDVTTSLESTQDAEHIYELNVRLSEVDALLSRQDEEAL